MAHKHIHPQALAFAAETTPCEPTSSLSSETPQEGPAKRLRIGLICSNLF